MTDKVELIDISLDDDVTKKQNEEYFKYKSLISSYNKDKTSDSKPPLFITSVDNNVSEFETLMTSNDDKSAIISLIQRKLNLWCNESFWNELINLNRIMHHYAIDENLNIKNLFSILLYDWCEPENLENFYFLKIKFENFDRNCGREENLFGRLCEISNLFPHYGDVCARILKFYINELGREEVEEIHKKLLEFVEFATTIENFEIKIKVIKNLMILLRNDVDYEEENDENFYNKIKTEITKTVKCNLKFDSIYMKSLKDIEVVCAEKFFELIFLLHERKLVKFQQKFKELLENFQNFFGNYWKIAIKNDFELLIKITNKLNLLRISQFIKKSCDFSEVRIEDFQMVLNEPLGEVEEETLDLLDFALSKCPSNDEERIDLFIKYYKIEKVNKKLVFGRKSHEEMSIFEKISSNGNIHSVLRDVWEKFSLWDYPDFLMKKNPLGKSILNYIIESKSENQLISFLSIPLAKSPDKYSRKCYLMFLNTQFCEITKKSLIENLVELMKNHKDSLIVKKLLIFYFDEVGEVDISNDDTVVKLLLSLMKSGQKSLEVDETLRIMIGYWKNIEKLELKQEILKILPHFELLFLVKEGKFKEFTNIYNLKMQGFENFAKSLTQDVENSIRIFNFTLLKIAIKNNQKEIINFIFDIDLFEDFETFLSESIEVKEIHNHTVLELIKRRNNINLRNFPENWLTFDVLKSFLDSKLIDYNQQFIEMDFRFLEKNFEKGNNRELTDKLLMFEDVNLLNYIIKKGSTNKQEILTHPAIETFIMLRSYKYRRIASFDYFSFFIFFIIPFLFLIYFNHNSEEKVNFWSHFGLEKLHYFGIIYLIIREILKYPTETKIVNYFMKKSNYYDLLIITSIIVSILSSMTSVPEKLKISESLLILLAAIHGTKLLTLKKATIYLTMLKKISSNFLLMFDVFLYIFFGLTLCYCIMFEDYKYDCDENEEKQPRIAFKNLLYPFTSSVRILTMLSGEYSMDVNIMNFFQIIYFLIFVITSFILFNLILGVSFDSIEKVMNESRQNYVLETTKKIIEISGKFSRFYENQGLSPSNNSWKRIIFRFFLTRYEFIHNISKIYIDKRNKEVFVIINGKKEKVLKIYQENYSEEFDLEDEIYQKICEILREKK
ncbi:hypothetical protein PVAND_006325 [Polypedilum vanderplanki]|uniref:Ion transport domain-containing protein n=1 Tax=Polypedilum vanderplanki TaxID=319348 RepID=A0A9J6C4K7_POLVA|nr:hypothetical protein PVAND_006325 [Polypedilum vanderplanki]